MQDCPDFDIWKGHPDYPVEDWQYEVANNDTRRGYRDWVLHRLEMAADEREYQSGEGT